MTSLTLPRFFAVVFLGVILSLMPLIPAHAIVGGTTVPTDPGSNPPTQSLYPWNAFIHFGNQSDLTCGATLIGSRFAITAAQCVHHQDVDDMYVTVGGYSLDHDQKTGQTIRINSVIEHPYFDDDTRSNNLAVIVLDHDAVNVQTPIYITQTEIGAGRTATIIGWGATVEDGPTVKQLQQAQVNTIDRATCEAQLGGLHFPFDASNICAGVASGAQDSCQGDRGGPLFIVRPDGKPVQIGVTSWGQGCGRPDFPGAYSNLANMLGFILDTLGGQNMVRLADYAQNGNQKRVAQILDQIGPAAHCDSSLQQDYGRLFMNGVNGTAASLQSLLPTSAFEAEAIVSAFTSAEGFNIMPHLRALHEGLGSSGIDLSGLHMVNTTPVGGSNYAPGYAGTSTTLDLTSAGTATPASAASPNAGRMYNPELYAPAPSAAPTTGVASVPLTNAPVTLGVTTIEATATPPSVATERSGAYTVIDAEGSKAVPGRASRNVQAAGYRQVAEKSTSETLMGWLDGLFGGPGINDSPRPGVPRTAATTSRDTIYQQASSHYPGQPLGMYVQHKANEGDATQDTLVLGDSPGTVRVPLTNQYAMLVDPTGMRQSAWSSANAVDLTATSAATTPGYAPSQALAPAAPGQVPSRLGSVAVPYSPATAMAPASSPAMMPTAAINVDRRWGVFVSGDVRFGNEQLINDGDRTKMVNGGFTVGLDYRIRDKSFIGLAFTYAHGSFTTNDFSDVQGDGYAVSLYGTTTFLKSAYLDGFISTGFHTFDSQRTLFVGNGETRVAEASPDAFHFSGQAETGYNVNQGPWQFGPFAGFKLAFASFEEYSENGAGNFNLDVNSRDQLSAISSLGIGGSRRFTMSNGGVVQPALRAAFNHEFGDSQSDVTSNFAIAQNLPFVTEGAKRDRNWLSLNPSVTAALPNNWMFQAEYEHDFMRSDVSANIFNLAARYKW